MKNKLFTFKELQAATSGTWHNIDISNTSCVDSGITSVSTDTRKNNNNDIFLALSGTNFDAHNFLTEAIDSRASALCLQKGKYEREKLPINIPILEVDNTLQAYQDLANFHRKRQKDLTLIAITGSNGKTSTKDILQSLLSSIFGQEKVYTTKANTNNLIGVPQNILNITDKHKFAVIELGSNHPGEIQQLADIANPDIAVITSIGASHLEFFKDIAGVIKEKISIFTAFNNPEKATAIFPEEFKNNSLFLQQTKKGKTMTFGEEKNADIKYKLLQTKIDGSKFELRYLDKITEEISWNIPGKHQICNAAAAASIATAIGINPQDISTALQQCKIITGMRMDIKNHKGITWINDAYNANPTSIKAGIDWLHEITKDATINSDERIFVVLGDMLELGKNAEEIHKEIIEYAMNKLPSSQIYGVGSIMHETINRLNKNPESSKAFLNADDAASFFIDQLKAGDMIYLKGSRGIALEKIERSFIESE